MSVRFCDGVRKTVFALWKVKRTYFFSGLSTITVSPFKGTKKNLFQPFFYTLQLHIQENAKLVVFSAPTLPMFFFHHFGSLSCEVKGGLLASCR